MTVYISGLCSKAIRDVDLTFDDLQSLIKSGDVRLIDVREPSELVEYGSYPAAVNIPRKSLWCQKCQFHYLFLVSLS